MDMFFRQSQKLDLNVTISELFEESLPPLVAIEFTRRYIKWLVRYFVIFLGAMQEQKSLSINYS